MRQFLAESLLLAGCAGGLGREGIVLVAIGFTISVPGIFLVTNAVAQLMAGLSTVAPTTSVGVGLILFLVSLLACYIPARRAAGLHPLVALRYE